MDNGSWFKLLEFILIDIVQPGVVQATRELLGELSCYEPESFCHSDV